MLLCIGYTRKANCHVRASGHVTGQHQLIAVHALYCGSNAASNQTRQAATQPAGPKRAPRPFVTKSELEKCSNYLVGRWTQQKINAAIEELAGVYL